MLGFCSNGAKKPLPREAVRTLVVLGVAYAMVRVWYTLAGNCTASISGGGYMGGGATLAPGCVMGYIAARHALGIA